MKRDPNVIEATDYLDEVLSSFEERTKGASREEVLGLAWASLHPNIKQWIRAQILRCRKEPRWLFGNYFWIQHPRSGEPTTLDLFDAQELILETIEWLWRQGRPGWVLCHKARQLGCCLHPSTRVLTSDLRWVYIDDLKVGDKLVATDEDFPPGEEGKRRNARRMREATVEAKREVLDYAVKITMDNGETLVATPDHRFLSQVRGSVSTKWCRVKDMRIGDEIRKICDTWGPSSSDDYWFGGILDGEGCLRSKFGAGVELCAAQSFGAVLDRIKAYVSKEKYDWRLDIDRRKGGGKTKSGKDGKFGNKPVAKVLIGRMGQIFKMLGKTRPTRFLERLWWEGKELPGKGGKNGRNGGHAWSKIVKMELLLQQRMIDLQTSTKTFIAEGFVSHNSTIALALLVWRVCFHSQVISLILAQDEGQATYELSIFQWFMNNLPWWLKPNIARQHIEARMVMGIQDESGYGGLNSYIIGASIKKMSAFAQGKPFSDVHITEVGSYPDHVARKIIDEDLSQMVSRPGLVGIMESKPYGASGWWYNTWHHYAKQGKSALWHAMFLPCFMEKSRTTVVPAAFKPNKEELKIRERYLLEWKVCPNCKAMYYSGGVQGSSAAECHRCGSTGGQGVLLTDGQLGWYRMAKSKVRDQETEQSFLQEFAMTAEEGFQVHGKMVFPRDVYRYVQSTVQDPVWVGEWRSDFTFHCKGKHCCNPDCRQQNISHDEDELNLKVWEMPEEGARYYLGADAGYGEEEGDFGVASVHKCGRGHDQPDTQVAEWRGRGDAGALGTVIYILATVYKHCEVAIEVRNGPGEKAQLKLIMMGYDRLYRWKHYDSVHMMSQKLGWVTNARTKPMLITTFIEWCRQRLIVIKSKDFLFEMPSFIKRADYDESGEAASGHHDDTIISNVICLHCHHDEDYDPERGRIIIPHERLRPPDPSDPRSGLYVMTCMKGHVTTAENPHGWYCPECRAANDTARVPALSATRARGRTAQLTIDLNAPVPRNERVFVGQSEQVEIV